MKRTFAALVLALAPLTAAAMEPLVPNPELEGRTWQESAPSSGMAMTFDSVDFNSSSRELVVDVGLVNESSHFLPTLSYTLSLYEGRPTDGTVQGLNLTTFFTGELSGLPPAGAEGRQIIAQVPQAIDPGEYSLRLVVNDAEMSAFALGVYGEPVALSGTGGHLGYPDPFVRLSNGDVIGLGVGAALAPSEGFSIGLDLSAAPDLARAVSSGVEFAAEATVWNLRGEEAHRFDATPFRQETVNGAPALLADFSGWSGEPGPYTLEVLVLTAGEPAALDPIEARWLVDGFVSRIHRLETPANAYRDGDSLAISGTVTAHGHEGGERATLEVTLVEVDGGVETYETDIVYPDHEGEFVDFSFSDQVSRGDAALSRIDAVLTLEGGRVLDRYSVPVESELEYAAPSSSDDAGFIPRASLVGIIGLAALGLVYAAFRRRVAPAATFVAILAASLWLTLTGAVVAEHPVTSSASVYFSKVETGKLGVCPQTVDTLFAGHAFCEHCMNGTEWVGYVEYVYKNGVTGRTADMVGSFPGGMANNFPAGPYSAKIALGAAGKDAVSYRGVAYVRRTSPVHGFCNASTVYYTQYYSASCVSDLCTNIAGNQSSVPFGMQRDSAGKCDCPPGSTFDDVDGRCEDTGGRCTTCGGNGCSKGYKNCNGVCVSEGESCDTITVDQCVFVPEGDQYCVEIFDRNGKRTDQLPGQDMADLEQMFGAGLRQAVTQQQAGIKASGSTYPVWGVVGRVVSGGGINANYSSSGCAGALCAFGEQGCLTTTDPVTGRPVGNCCPINDATGGGKEPSATIDVEPSVIGQGGKCEVFWSSHEMKTCAVKGFGLSSTALAGATTTPPLDNSAAYTIECKGLDGNTYTDADQCVVDPDAIEF
jgi:hypothetical protein